ncbi:DUF4391 domain-containing protein [Ancylomarina longa]|uniref:DUF4391 family protein n=1 Tax=Ancylomarina longa TaxID=2487017 RepID=A0A434AVB9_9BACT|nr:DUF4391 domain-containing protein [Ancylomarina longa]RUT78425.1 DUF4391 family protein [Ancylomarina longa]
MHKINFPLSTKVERIIAKDRIFKQTAVSDKIKHLFVEQVDRIRCIYEITAQTLNLKSSDQVPKIFIIQISSKANELSLDILKTIDAAFQVPVIFELVQNKKTQYIASYRRRSEMDHRKWIHSQYFFSDSINDKNEETVPFVLSMEKLYHHLLKQIIPIQVAKEESFSLFIERAASIEQMQKQADRLLLRVNKEKQYNRRVELNQEYKKLLVSIEEKQSILN